MTPAARYASAIEILDAVLAGASAEKSLTSWARANRYAGSKDRAAVRDHVFDVLRRKRSLAAIGGTLSGRGLTIGLLRFQGIDTAANFGAGGYGPPALTADEIALGETPAQGAQACDLPDWLWPIWQADLGDGAQACAAVLQERGPISLRVNLGRCSRAQAADMLAQDGVVTVPSTDVKTGLQVVENERKVKTSAAYLQGFVEVQDIASQVAVAALDISDGARVLDYCAGGGGKALAIADQYQCRVVAHDISAARMADIPVRADRAGVTIEVMETAQLAGCDPFDVVFVDAPCSGSGTWRRAPEAKWAFTSEKLLSFNALQGEVLAKSAEFVAINGTLIYATCSVLAAENGAIVSKFLADRPEWRCLHEKQRLPDALGDGFYHAILHRA